MTWRNFKFWLMKKMCSEAEWKTLLNIKQGFYDYQEEVKRMTRQEAADCLLDKVNCKYCDQADGDCRQEAIEMAKRQDYQRLMIDSYKKMYTKEFLKKNRRR